jgi:hypothetical protein
VLLTDTILNKEDMKMIYENVSKPTFKRSKKEAKRRFSQQGYQGNQTPSDLDVMDMPEPLESWSLDDFNDVVYLERG